MLEETATQAPLSDDDWTRPQKHSNSRVPCLQPIAYPVTITPQCIDRMVLLLKVQIQPIVYLPSTVPPGTFIRLMLSGVRGFFSRTISRFQIHKYQLPHPSLSRSVHGSLLLRLASSSVRNVMYLHTSLRSLPQADNRLLG